MSQKWHRSRRWDDEHIPGWAWPVKLLLRAFSSIPLAVCLLSLLVVYAILASVPIGLLALAPTYLLYGLTLVACILLAAVAPAVLVGIGAARRWPRARAGRFVATVVVGVGLAVVVGWFWLVQVWPALRYDPATEQGVRLFAGFVDAYKATTLRRLPGVEMSELEFYSWWPLRVVLLAFVANMVTATVRRIEFVFPNLGVLTVHTGIVTIALGSIYYKGLKLEGDTLLLRGDVAPDGTPSPGPPQDSFYDNTGVALWVGNGVSGWEQRPLAGVPRYNDYNLGAIEGTGVRSAIDEAGGERRASDRGRVLSLDVTASVSPGEMGVDPDIRFRVVGYASYADPVDDWVRADPPDRVRPGVTLNPLRMVDLISDLADAQGRVSTEPVARFFFLLDQPRHRVSENEVFGFEATRGMSEARWADLGEPLPEGTEYGIVVEVPNAPGGTPFRGVYPVRGSDEIVIGDTGFRVAVKSISPRPPFPIITAGYQDASSSVAIVRITAPGGASYDRWVYHRFPEISQDLLDETNERGMPMRRNADPAIRVSLIDASKLQVYLDEGPDQAVRSIVRTRGGAVRVAGALAPGALLEIMDKIRVRVGERWAHAERIERPRVVPEEGRNNEDVGTHKRAMLAVEVAAGQWRRVVWLPFTQYLMQDMETARVVDLPDGRRVSLAFGRRMHELAGMAIQLVDFTMIAYEHRGSPRDYRSVVRVMPTSGSFEAYEHVTQLNAPLQAPFMWSDQRSWLSNAALTVASRLSPQQFKLSQAGWDAEGWERTQALVDQGVLRRPYASFTILQVGNNPGIHIVAIGGVMMAVGIPWAFYIKPLIMRRRRDRIKAQLAAGEYVRPGGAREMAGARS